MVAQLRNYIGGLKLSTGAGLVVLAWFALAPAGAAVVATAHYQADFVLECTATTCSIDMPVVAPDRRLLVHWVSCRIASVPAARFYNGSFQVKNDSKTFLVTYLGSTIHRYGGIHILNQEMDVLVGPGRRGFILLQVTDGEIGSASCAVTGIQEVLD